jgi:hypothetical protein
MKIKSRSQNIGKSRSVSVDEEKLPGFVGISNIWKGTVKFFVFWVVAVKEMAFAFKSVYKSFYSGDESAKRDYSFLEEEDRKIVCPICGKDFVKDDAVVKCPEQGCGEVYHYICWHYSHGCIRPGCHAVLENPRNLTIH